MTNDTLGDGFALNEDFDFKLTTSGDLGGVSGAEELGKDIAFSTALQLRDDVGRPLTENAKSQMRLEVRRVLGADERIESIEQLEIVESGKNEVEIKVTVVTVDSTVENITFTV